jgi:chemotaxis protein CheC
MSAAQPLPDWPAARADDRLRELASIGAGHAANALAALIGDTVRIEVPRLVERLRAQDLAIDARPPDAALVFEIEGGAGGRIVMLFGPDDAHALFSKFEIDPRDAAARRSLLAEVGNILVSRLVSAVADVLGTRILPSTPRIEERAAAAAAVDAVRCATRAGSPSALVRLCSDRGDLKTSIVFAPAHAGRIPAST